MTCVGPEKLSYTARAVETPPRRRGCGGVCRTPFSLGEVLYQRLLTRCGAETNGILMMAGLPCAALTALSPCVSLAAALG